MNSAKARPDSSAGSKGEMFTNSKTGQLARSALDLWMVVLLAAVVACQKPQVSTYMVAKQDLVVERPEGLDAWQVPEGWLGRLSVPPTVATFRVFNNAPQGNATHPAGGSATVMVVKLKGSEGGLEPNMARWARQVGLEPPVGNEAVKALSTVEIDGRTATRIRFKNPADGRALLVDWVETEGFSWFFKISGDSTVVEQSIPAMDAFTASIRFTVIDRVRKRPLPGLASWEVPAGWVPGQSRPFVLGTFQIPGEQADVELTISRASGELSAQFDRWARLMQLDKPADPIKEWVMQTEVDGRAAHLVDMHNPETGRRMKLVMIPGGPGRESWFFKMSGHDVVTDTKGGEFNAFIKSIKFAEDGERN